MNQIKNLLQKLQPHASSTPIPLETTKSCTTTATSLPPFLRLPAELRLQIYSYLDLTDHIIEVTSTHQHLEYRLEHTTDHEPSRRPRYSRIEALFPITSLCQKLRNETIDILYTRNAFSFTDRTYNYASAFPLFVSSLPSKHIELVKTIYWPLRQARDFQRFGHAMELPDRSCVDEFAKCTGLQKVVLRYVATDVGNAKMAVHEQAEFEERGEMGYKEDRRFRRELAVRGMREVLEKEGVDVVCERSWRAHF